MNQKLLSLGGTKVSPQPFSMASNYKLDMSNSEYFPGDAKRVKGNYNRCFENSALHYINDPYNVDVYIGYALCDDDMWRPHSWIIKKGEIKETTRNKMKAYYGVKLNVEQTSLLTLNEVFMALPGFKSIMNAIEEV